MPDWLSIAERGLKAVRYGIFQASDNISLLLDGLCCAPEESKGDCGSCGRPKDAAHRPDCCNPDAREFAFDDVPTNRRATPAQFLAAYGRIPSYARDSAAASPAAAVVAPSPKQGSDSGPADCDILTSPSGGTQTAQEMFDGFMDEMFSGTADDAWSTLPDVLRGMADYLDPPSK